MRLRARRVRGRERPKPDGESEPSAPGEPR